MNNIFFYKKNIIKYIKIYLSNINELIDTIIINKKNTFQKKVYQKYFL